MSPTNQSNDMSNSSEQPLLVAQNVGKLWQFNIVIGCLAAFAALFMVPLEFLVGLSSAMVVHGVIQIAVGVLLIVQGWLVRSNKSSLIVLAVCILILLANAAGLAWSVFEHLRSSQRVNQNQQVLTILDPDSPTSVMLVRREKFAEDESPWFAIVSVDGKRATQTLRWPKHFTTHQASPVKLLWHNEDPDWVEVHLDNNFALQLNWDAQLAEEARYKTEESYFLNAKIQLLE